tara:strand:+ start:1374 stop:1520 length:147 start_codon:yes stop_codon:yes gene_type:complete
MITLEELEEIFDVLMDTEAYKLASIVSKEISDRKVLKNLILDYVEGDS